MIAERTDIIVAHVPPLPDSIPNQSNNSSRMHWMLHYTKAPFGVNQPECEEAEGLGARRGRPALIGAGQAAGGTGAR